MSEQTPQKRPGAIMTLHFEHALPCTTQDCENMATVGTAQYDPEWNGWMLHPLCKPCTQKLMHAYESGGVPQEEASEQQ